MKTFFAILFPIMANNIPYKAVCKWYIPEGRHQQETNTIKYL